MHGRSCNQRFDIPMVAVSQKPDHRLRVIQFVLLQAIACFPNIQNYAPVRSQSWRPVIGHREDDVRNAGWTRLIHREPDRTAGCRHRDCRFRRIALRNRDRGHVRARPSPAISE